MYSECKGSQDKKIVMVSIRKGPWERRCGMKRSDEEKSATQEENCNRMGWRSEDRGAWSKVKYHLLEFL